MPSIQKFEHPAKLERGRNNSSASDRRGQAPGLLELSVLFHTGLLTLFLTWGFGGNALWLRDYLLVWTLLGLVPTIWLLLDTKATGWPLRNLLLWLSPLVVLNAYVAVSSLNPNVRQLTLGAENLLVPGGENPWLPSSTGASEAWATLLVLDACYLAAFNLGVGLNSRRRLRQFLFFLGANALVLSIFGTLQKLSGAAGLYFGWVASPNPAFFSTFIYHNHWGAYVLLGITICLALAWHHLRRNDSEYRDFWHSPGFGGTVSVLFLAATIPLSSSRSSTVLAILLLSVGFVHWAAYVAKRRKASNESPLAPWLLAVFLLLVSATAVFWLARPVIEKRWHTTRTQIELAQEKGGVGGREILYRDTLRMAGDKLLFGWGMGSYPIAFRFFNTQEPNKVDKLPIYYADAHSDWLQALAELGLLGSGLMAALALLPLSSLRKAPRLGPLPLYLLGGATLVLLYALIEFPFGCPGVQLHWWLCAMIAVAYARAD